MATGRDMRGRAAKPGRVAGTGTRNTPPRRRTGPLHWFLFDSACAAASTTLMWCAPVVPLPGLARGAAFVVAALAIPLALLLVPGFLLRRVKHRRTPRTAVAALVVALPAAVVLAVLTREAGEERALEKRGRWAEAVVVDVENGRSDTCTLRTRDGRAISPPMTQDCDADLDEPGDRLRVLYDPEGAAGPLTDEITRVDLDPGAYATGVGGLAALTVVAGTYGCARLSRATA
ncbi:hypothetical protein ACFVOR_00115 [Streptomyces sp. NPDC057837]|uniref:hypothetical protein n=1 Tax=Streptomyces sp. NPDC057837 TaxID=3346260 RepID=UPI003685C8B0